ncbi:MAG: glutamyl-tRNA reductase, partial [Candidatus Bipolaricaulia bacterium]
CNRTEIYYVSEMEEGLQGIEDWVCRTKDLAREILKEEAYTLKGGEVVRHLYRVISGLDSMVLGESEIAGQVKEAYYRSHELGGTGKFLNKLFHSAFDLNKRVRNETAIGQRRTSVAKVAIHLAEERLGDLRDCRAMVIGAGAMGKRVLQFLLEAGIGRIYVANRTLERSYRLTRELGGEALAFQDRARLLAEVDLVISATACHRYLIGREDLASVKRSTPLCCIDISVPRSIDPRVGEYEFCRLMDIDDLKQLAERESERLRGAIGEAERIIERAAADFAGWLRVQEIVPLIGFMQQRVEEIRQRELKKLNSHLLEEHGEQLDRFSKRLINTLLHHHMTALKEAAREGRNGYAEVIRSIFHPEERGGHRRAGPAPAKLQEKDGK